MHIIKFSDFYDSSKEKSDKGTRHSYIKNFYCKEFTPKRLLPLNIVEIGIYKGESLRLFREYFPNATITGIDQERQKNFEEIYTTKNINCIEKNAYKLYTAEFFEYESIDYLIDDGPHSLESQIDCVRFYWDKIKKGGKIIIEDVKKIDEVRHIFQILTCTLGESKLEIKDYRKLKNVSDDVLVIFTKC